MTSILGALVPEKHQARAAATHRQQKRKPPDGSGAVGGRRQRGSGRGAGAAGDRSQGAVSSMAVERMRCPRGNLQRSARALSRRRAGSRLCSSPAWTGASGLLSTAEVQVGFRTAEVWRSCGLLLTVAEFHSGRPGGRLCCVLALPIIAPSD